VKPFLRERRMKVAILDDYQDVALRLAEVVRRQAARGDHGVQ
jgi:hypothetical protein